MKISKIKFNKIIERIEEEGENFTSIAKEYSTTAWNIQKRYGKNKPNQYFDVWEYAPEFQKTCIFLARKFKNFDKNFDVYDAAMDMAIALPPYGRKKVKKYGEKGLYYFLYNRIIQTNMKLINEKRTGRIVPSSHGDVILHDGNVKYISEQFLPATA